MTSNDTTGPEGAPERVAMGYIGNGQWMQRHAFMPVLGDVEYVRADLYDAVVSERDALTAENARLRDESEERHQQVYRQDDKIRELRGLVADSIVTDEGFALQVIEARQEAATLRAQLAIAEGERDSEERWAKQYHDEAQALRAQLAQAEQDEQAADTRANNLEVMFEYANEEIARLKAERDEARAQLATATEREARLREALELYADESNWEESDDGYLANWLFAKVGQEFNLNGPDLARAALAPTTAAPEFCGYCHGTGVVEFADGAPCPKCQGKVALTTAATGQEEAMELCPNCEGRPDIADMCGLCCGAGQVPASGTTEGSDE